MQLCLKSVKTDLGRVWLVLRTNSMLFCEHTVYSFLGTWIRGENYMLLTFLRWPWTSQEVCHLPVCFYPLPQYGWWWKGLQWPQALFLCVAYISPLSPTTASSSFSLICCLFQLPLFLMSFNSLFSLTWDGMGRAVEAVLRAGPISGTCWWFTEGLETVDPLNMETLLCMFPTSLISHFADLFTVDKYYSEC